MQKNKSVLSKTSLLQKISLILLGAFLFTVFLEIGLRAAGSIFLFLQDHRNMVSIRQKGACRIMCVGESTTFWGGKAAYPSQLEEVLNSSGLGKKFSVINKGVSGVNTSAIVASLEANLDKYKPDILITMMGINDEGNYVFYEDSVFSSSSATFLKQFKIYKLIKLLFFHITTKTNVARIPSVGENEKIFPENSNQNEKQLMQSFILDAKDSGDYMRLGQLYRSKEDYLKAENAFKKAIEVGPQDENAYFALGWFYNDISNYIKAEELFKKATEINPEKDWLYIGIGEFYRIRMKYAQSEESFKKAIALNPDNEQGYIKLGLLYSDQGKHAQAEEWFSRAIAHAVEKDKTNHELGRFNEKKGKDLFDRRIPKEARELNSQADRLYAEIAILNMEIGNFENAKQYYKRAEELRLKYYNPVTLRNYRKLKEIADNRKTKLICVQYPMRNVEPLKKIFKGCEGVIFVNNEGIFKDALRKAGYREYFTDIFGGDFGHCTEKGNRLLAENIAQVILKEYFKR